MASLIEQMQQLQKQQADLAEKIIERKQEKRDRCQSSIELEALISPITQKLDYLPLHGPNKGKFI